MTQNATKNSYKKTKKNRVGPGVPPGRKGGGALHCAVIPFFDHFRPKIKKRRKKGGPKMDSAKGPNIDAKSMAKGGQNEGKNR